MTWSRIDVVLAFFFGGGLAFFVVRGEQKRSSSSLESDILLNRLRGGVAVALLYFVAVSTASPCGFEMSAALLGGNASGAELLLAHRF